MMNNRVCTYLIAACLFAAWLPAQAATYEAEGIAAINPGGVEQARQAAIQDAIRQASMQAGANIESAERVSASGLALNSSRLRSIKELDKVVVLREWRDGDFLHVLIRAEDEPSGPASVSTQSYRKKITATPFTIPRSLQLDDIDDMSNGFPRELLFRLENTRKFLTRFSRFALAPEIRGEIPSANNVRQLADLQDSQFVISGAVLDAGSHSESKYFGLSETRTRRLQVELFVHDGLTGALIARHRIEKAVDDDVTVGRDKPFGSAAFLATNFGRAVGAIIDSLAKTIVDDLDPLPFTAKIVRVTGAQIYLDAGATSFLAPGDTLVAFQRKSEVGVGPFNVQAEYGVPETPVATLTVTRVQPLFSIGELSADAKNINLRVGDYVRFDSSRRK